MEPNIQRLDSGDSHRGGARGAAASPTTSLHPLQNLSREQGNAYLNLDFSERKKISLFIGVERKRIRCVLHFPLRSY